MIPHRGRPPVRRKPRFRSNADFPAGLRNSMKRKCPAMTEMAHAVFAEPGGSPWKEWLGHTVEFIGAGEGAEMPHGFTRHRIPPGIEAFANIQLQHGVGFYALDEGIEADTAGGRAQLEPGGFVHIPRGEFFRLRNAGSKPAEALAIHAPAGLNRFLWDTGCPLPNPSDVPGVPNGAHLDSLKTAAPNYGIRFGNGDAPPAAQPEAAPPAGRDTLAIVGDVYRFMADSKSTDGDYAICEAFIFPGGGPPPHIHMREDESFYILEGELTFEAGGATIAAPAGSFLNVPPGCLHRFQNQTGRTAKALIFVVPGGFEQIFFEAGRPWSDPTRKPGVTDEEIGKLIELAPRYGLELRLPGTPP